MRLKKNLLATLALVLVLSMMLTACGNSGGNDTPSTETPNSGDNVNDAPITPGSGDSTMQTNNSDKKTVDIGSFTGEAAAPVLITSVGQSADSSMLDALMTRLDVEYTYDSTAVASDVSNYGTVLICAGASSKGLGAAGISADDEKARATELLAACESSGITVVVCHLGGTARRGELSDEFSDMCLPYADYIIVVEEGDDDGKFSGFASANGTPITLVNTIADTLAPLTNLFG